jgi:hypothetical protein
MLDFAQVAGFAGEASRGILVILAWTEIVNLMSLHKSATYLNRVTCVSEKRGLSGEHCLTLLRSREMETNPSKRRIESGRLLGFWGAWYEMYRAVYPESCENQGQMIEHLTLGYALG